MAIGFIDWDSFRRQMLEGMIEVCGLMGIQVEVSEWQSHRSFWHKLRDEIAARPRVF